MGFIRSRLTTDNVRRLLHVINGAQDLTSPAAVLSLDAMMIAWSGQWSVLETMNFGTPFINMIRVLYKNPTGVVLIGKTCSPAFAILKRFKTRLPPELVALSLEPLAQAIRCLPTFSPISNKGTHHHISLYAQTFYCTLKTQYNVFPIFYHFSDSMESYLVLK